MSFPEPIRFPIARDMALGPGLLELEREDGLGMVWLVQGLVRVEGECRQRSGQDGDGRECLGEKGKVRPGAGWSGTSWDEGRSGVVRDGQSSRSGTERRGKSAESWMRRRKNRLFGTGWGRTGSESRKSRFGPAWHVLLAGGSGIWLRRDTGAARSGLASQRGAVGPGQVSLRERLGWVRIG